MAEAEASTSSCQTCWDNIRAKTGFGSYAEYIQAYTRVSHHRSLKMLKPFMNRIAGDSEKGFRPWLCSTMDVRKGKDSGICVSKRQIDGTNTSFNQLFETVHHPPQEISFRVVWWDFEHRAYLSPELLDTFGLGFMLGPRFFESMVNQIQLRRPEYLAGANTVSSAPTHIVLGDTIATIARSHVRDQADARPVLLILSRYDVPIKDLPSELTEHNEAFNEEQPVGSKVVRGWLQTYATLLDVLFRSRKQSAHTDLDLQLLCVLPLLQLDAIRMQLSTRWLRASYLQINDGRGFERFVPRDRAGDDALRDVQEKRYELRQRIEDHTVNHFRFLRYARLHFGQALVEKDSYIEINELWDHALGEARRLELQVRDDLQLMNGYLSLEESRKSIELSNTQIREGKRVTIITILAFIYIPFNTVTSIYSMNIKQINGVGHNMWLFWVTAIAVLLLTGLAWFMFVEVNKAMAFRELVIQEAMQGRPPLKQPQSFFRFGGRIFLLIWLIKRGRLLWMFKSGAWLKILISSKQPPRTPNVPYISVTSACHFAAHIMAYESTGNVTWHNTHEIWDVTWKDGHGVEWTDSDGVRVGSLYS